MDGSERRSRRKIRKCASFSFVQFFPSFVSPQTASSPFFFHSWTEPKDDPTTRSKRTTASHPIPVLHSETSPEKQHCRWVVQSSLRSALEAIVFFPVLNIILNDTGLRDIGSCPPDFVMDLLPLCTAQQLIELETNSSSLQGKLEGKPSFLTWMWPHGINHSCALLKNIYTAIWRHLTLTTFLSQRIVAEDHPELSPPASWKARYIECEVEEEARMIRLREKMREGYKKAGERATTLVFDGVRAEKRRKITSCEFSR